MEKSFNLVSEEWIKVISTDTYVEKTVSIFDLFKNAHKYRQLAGEMKSQDLAVMRLLLAILITAYSRQQANWESLYNNGSFDETVINYLKDNLDDFDFFGEHPFWQVTADEYNSLVPDNKKISTGTGTVAVKQIDRLVNESGNTPNIFSPRAGKFKDIIPLDSLIRWIITYQNYTGVTDKTKISVSAKDKFKANAGWLYKLTPVFAKGKNLFETLMLNVSFDNYVEQRPIWEFKSAREYVDYRCELKVPDNLAELYTSGSRIIHIEWQDDKPTIYSAAIPMFDNLNVFIESMTTWKQDKDIANGFRPKIKSLTNINQNMWWNFDDYFSDEHILGIIQLLKKRYENGIGLGNHIELVSNTLVSEDNQSSQRPAAEYSDNLVINTDIIFNNKWVRIIQRAVDQAQEIGNEVYNFSKKLTKLRGVDSNVPAKKSLLDFERSCDKPFRDWIDSIESQDNTDQKVDEWKEQLQKISDRQMEEMMKHLSPREINGVDDQNVFKFEAGLNYGIRTVLEK